MAGRIPPRRTASSRRSAPRRSTASCAPCATRTSRTPRCPPSSRTRMSARSGVSWTERPRRKTSKMKIKNITPLVLGTPWRNLTFLKVETDEGLVGYSEGRNVNRTEALLGYLQGAKKRYVLGSDPFRIEELVHRMFIGDFARIDDIA